MFNPGLELFFILILFGPFLFTLIDKNTSGREKIGWAIITFFFSYLALPFYLIITKKSK